MKNIRRVTFKNFLCAGVLLSLGFAPGTNGGETYWERQLRLYGKMNLPVDAILEAKYTSCGEAAITMAYNYAYPEDKVSEQKVIDYALSAGYFTERTLPFTSPKDMVKIAKHYADTVSRGQVKTEEEGLSLLTRQ